MKIRKIVGMGIAALTDIAAGIIIVHLMGKAFGYDVPIYFYPIGVFLALLPDLDYVYKLWQKWRGNIEVIKTHKAFPHYPIIMMIPICSILGVLSIFWSIFGYWAVVTLLCLLGHYIHDTIEAQTGMRWLAPIDKRYYRPFTEKGGRLHLFCSFSDEDIENKSLISDSEWFEIRYLRPTKESVMGVVLFVGAIILAILW